MEITYDMLKPILISESMEGHVLKCVFKAQNQLQPVEAQFVFMPDDRDQALHTGKQAVKRSFFSSIVSVFTGSVSNAAGGGAMGNVVGNAVSGGAHAVYNSSEGADVGARVSVSDEKRKQGVVNAFKNVRSHYLYENGTWIYKK